MRRSGLLLGVDFEGDLPDDSLRLFDRFGGCYVALAGGLEVRAGVSFVRGVWAVHGTELLR